jgi:hypothetical protein
VNGVSGPEHRPVAVATDVGAWRVLEPVVRELQRRGTPSRVLLGGPAASVACQDGVEHQRLGGASVAEQVAEVLAAEPTRLLLGTSVQPVVERALTGRARDLAAPIPTLAVLDAMLFVERRFGPGLSELPDLVACPDAETVLRLTEAGAPAARLVVTGNPTLEEIGLTAATPPPALAPDRPTDVLFVSSPVEDMRRRGTEFAIDERQTLDDILAALGALRDLSPAGFRVRVRWHPVQRPDRLPATPPGIVVESDDEPDRLRSCARARVVVGLSSTLLGEARLLPRAAVAYLPGPYWDRERVFAPSYGVRLARSADDVQALLAEALARPPDPPPLAEHLGASARVAALFEGLVEAPSH